MATKRAKKGSPEGILTVAAKTIGTAAGKIAAAAGLATPPKSKAKKAVKKYSATPAAKKPKKTVKKGAKKSS